MSSTSLVSSWYLYSRLKPSFVSPRSTSATTAYSKEQKRSIEAVLLPLFVIQETETLAFALPAGAAVV
jgi:hypothetical protein